MKMTVKAVAVCKGLVKQNQQNPAHADNEHGCRYQVNYQGGVQRLDHHPFPHHTPTHCPADDDALFHQAGRSGGIAKINGRGLGLVNERVQGWPGARPAINPDFVLEPLPHDGPSFNSMDWPLSPPCPVSGAPGSPPW